MIRLFSETIRQLTQSHGFNHVVVPKCTQLGKFKTIYTSHIIDKRGGMEVQYTNDWPQKLQTINLIEGFNIFYWKNEAMCDCLHKLSKVYNQSCDFEIL